MKLMKKLFGAALVTALVGCASTEFQHYEARSNTFTGTGGTKTVVDGIEFWENGDPPREFKILGIIDDDRHGGWIQGMMLKGDIAAKVRDAGGDAVILLSSDSYTSGYVTNGSATVYGNNVYGNSNTAAVQRKTRKYIVVKYLDRNTDAATQQPNSTAQSESASDVYREKSTSSSGFERDVYVDTATQTSDNVRLSEADSTTYSELNASSVGFEKDIYVGVITPRSILPSQTISISGSDRGKSNYGPGFDRDL